MYLISIEAMGSFIVEALTAHYSFGSERVWVFADSVYPRRGFRLRGRFPKLLRQSSRELSQRRPSLETQSLDNYQQESMAGYSPRQCRVYEVVIYFGVQSAG
ncbi:hypothetical protein VC83_08221 [Pseudogymnoascus destructans]|uniref:Uncharacterized protein n=1 Tax=Pseudogymnoascus destructans TaxID=655981 RepID=A0A177A198_9PEZI|nr:uncharacterized protein VC83_08221 [Pseudogymnoascus destructans]OAF55360.1 hypothetical protein VC83_08221 [Pseudogymnoascus destructans]